MSKSSVHSHTKNTLVAESSIEKDALQNQLYQAAYRGDLSLLKQCLKQGADMHDQNSNGDNALIIAASRGHSKVVFHLLNEGADITATDKNARNALMWSAWNGYSPTVDVLLSHINQHSLDLINQQDLFGMSALMCAVQHDRGIATNRIVKALLESGASKLLTDHASKTAADHAFSQKNTALGHIIKPTWKQAIIKTVTPFMLWLKTIWQRDRSEPTPHSTQSFSPPSAPILSEKSFDGLPTAIATPVDDKSTVQNSKMPMATAVPLPHTQLAKPDINTHSDTQTNHSVAQAVPVNGNIDQDVPKINPT